LVFNIAVLTFQMTWVLPLQILSGDAGRREYTSLFILSYLTDIYESHWQIVIKRRRVLQCFKNWTGETSADGSTARTMAKPQPNHSNNWTVNSASSRLAQLYYVVRFLKHCLILS
jgi:hypothetical protein